MRCVTIIRAILVRLLFAGHGFIAIWRLFMVTREFKYWYLAGTLAGLLIETLFTLGANKGKEWKWFCPSVFFYLASVVPAIWFLELHEMEKRISLKENIDNSTIIKNITEEELSMSIDDFGIEFRIPLKLSADLWLRLIEQFLLLMLIVGRWILPKGALSHDQLSQLLLVYVGTAADIVEFYEAFNEDKVKYNRMLCYILLGIWTGSLMQFTLVLTATRARRDQAGLSTLKAEHLTGCCNPEIYGILISICLQDCPFLVTRLLLIFYYGVVSYTNMFFTSKNSLVIILLVYRLIVVQAESRSKSKLQPPMTSKPTRTVSGNPAVYRAHLVNNNSDNAIQAKIRLVPVSGTLSRKNGIADPGRRSPSPFYDPTPERNSSGSPYRTTKEPGSESSTLVKEYLSV